MFIRLICHSKILEIMTKKDTLSDVYVFKFDYQVKSNELLTKGV